MERPKLEEIARLNINLWPDEFIIDLPYSMLMMLSLPEAERLVTMADEMANAAAKEQWEVTRVTTTGGDDYLGRKIVWQFRRPTCQKGSQK